MTLTIDAFLEDARAALSVLRQQPEIDADRLHVVGLSQGATLVPALLQQEPSVRSAAMIAAPSSPVDAVVASQIERLEMLADSVGTGQAVAGQLAAIRQSLTKLRELRDRPPANGFILGAPEGLWHSWIKLSDEVPQLIQNLPQPLLVVGGASDWNIGAREMDGWRQLFARPNAGPREVVILPCITHALNCLRESDPAAIGPDDFTNSVHPSVGKTIGSFLVHAGPRPNPS